jgi:GNAT superfamily N-acetyltransferase
MRVALAETEAERRACFPVLRQLRTHLTDEDAFLAQLGRQAAQGYRLAYVEAGGAVRAVAGFRLGETFFAGPWLYVDDLVTDEAQRSKGYGRALLEFLKAHALEHGCRELHLDSGVQRAEAHAFYFREGLRIASHHFQMKLGEGG